MLPELQFIITLASGILVLILFIFYFLSLRTKEKEVEKKEHQIDEGFHHVVDEAQAQERKIIEDATKQADQIIKESKYLTQSSKLEVDNAIKTVIAEIQKEGNVIAKSFTSEYSNSLKSLSNESLREFQNIMIQLQADLKKQNKLYQEQMLPEIQKEIKEYKKSKMQEIDKEIANILQKAAQEIFNKSISLADHQKVVVDSLEKAKKEGVFEN